MKALRVAVLVINLGAVVITGFNFELYGFISPYLFWIVLLNAGFVGMMVGFLLQP